MPEEAPSLRDIRSTLEAGGDVITRVSPRDNMYRPNRPEAYFERGRDAVRWLRLAMLAARADEPARVLDFPCGYGRVMRHIKAAFPGAHLVACDIDEVAADFCAEAFEAEAAYSSEDPEEIELEGSFDLIWCGSLLTHLPDHRWPGFLRFFNSVLAPGGVLLFTTYGRHVADKMRTGERSFPSVQESQDAMLAELSSKGFSYRDRPYQGRRFKSSQYGISLASPSWVCERLEELPSMRLISFAEGGWFDEQDVVSCMRVPAGGPPAEPG